MFRISYYVRANSDVRYVQVAAVGPRPVSPVGHSKPAGLCSSTEETRTRPSENQGFGTRERGHVCEGCIVRENWIAAELKSFIKILHQLRPDFPGESVHCVSRQVRIRLLVYMIKGGLYPQRKPSSVILCFGKLHSAQRQWFTWTEKVPPPGESWQNARRPDLNWSPVSSLTSNGSPASGAAASSGGGTRQRLLPRRTRRPAGLPSLG